jgi:hypothetical protein
MTHVRIILRSKTASVHVASEARATRVGKRTGRAALSSARRGEAWASSTRFHRPPEDVHRAGVKFHAGREEFHHGVVAFLRGVGELHALVEDFSRGMGDFLRPTVELLRLAEELHGGTEELHFDQELQGLKAGCPFLAI